MRAKIAAVILLSVACGGKSPTTPTTTTAPPTPQPNRPPVISSATVTPGFGIADLATFTIAASATDPDGDTLTYTWDVNGTSATGATRTFTLSSPGGAITATVTVTDGRGGSVSSSATAIAGSLWGIWSGTLGSFAFATGLTQASDGSITGQWAISTGFSGTLDPAVSNRVDLSGHVVLRFKVRQGAFDDFTIDGQLQPDGKTLLGTVTGSGFSGQLVMLTK